MTALPLPPLWAYLGLSGPVWAYLVQSGTIWAHLDLSGPRRVWASLGPFPVAMSGKPAAGRRQNLYKNNVIYMLFRVWRADCKDIYVGPGRVPYRKHVLFSRKLTPWSAPVQICV